MTDNTTYVGTGFSHNIPFSRYQSQTNEEILNNYPVYQNQSPQEETIEIEWSSHNTYEFDTANYVSENQICIQTITFSNDANTGLVILINSNRIGIQYNQEENKIIVQNIEYDSSFSINTNSIKIKYFYDNDYFAGFLNTDETLNNEFIINMNSDTSSILLCPNSEVISNFEINTVTQSINPPPIADVTGVCTYVVDGDTIDVDITRNNVTETMRVRLVGINTPEKNIDGYATSKSFVEKICLNQEIGLDIDEAKPTDKYGRTLAIVIVENKNLNQILLNEGLAEIMYIPPSNFDPSSWIIDNTTNNTDSEQNYSCGTNAINLNSTIINQKKKLLLYVTQSKDLVWPNGSYDYQIYVKNVSGQTITNLKIYIANPKEVVIKEKENEQQTYSIKELKTGQSVLLNVRDCTIMKEGYYYVNFVAMADETEIKTETLLIKCGFENDNKNTIHRIAFYNFSPYESAYMQKISDFNEDVTQLTKVQTKPFEAYNQPFETDELELDLYAQDIFLTNSDDMPSMYLGRENWESDLQESFTGQSLFNLIQNINKESNLVHIDYLRAGNNEMETDFQQIFPNGFIHRFGLIKSEFYKLLGIIPNIYSINDDLFRWARSEDEPVIYPKRENDKWNQKPWCGTGYYIYEIKTENDKIISTTEIAIFSTESDATIYVNDLEIFNELHFIEDISYEIKKRDWLPGIFYVEIPLRDIPANFYIPDTDEIQAVIELVKPYGLKGYPRFVLNNEFNHKLHFSNTPRISPHIAFDLGEYTTINYHIRTKKYQNDANGVVLKEYGKQASHIAFEPLLNNFFSNYPKPSVCKKLIKNIKYFIEHSENQEDMTYVHIYDTKYKNFFNNIYVDYSEDRFISLQESLGSDVTIETMKKTDIINTLQHNAIKIDGLRFNVGALDEKNITLEKFIRDYPEQDFLIAIDNFDNSISTESKINENDVETDKQCQTNKVECNQITQNPLQQTNEFTNPDETLNITIEQNNNKSFDGCRANDNSLDKLLIKNPEDISFYFKEQDGQFVTEFVQVPTKTIRIAAGYKTLNYYNEETSAVFNLQDSMQEPSAFKLYKQTNLPPNVNVNVLLSDINNAKDFIISYKLLYDDVYQISYKTLKKSEVIVKSIVTQFDYILCEIEQVSAREDLIKIYYALNNNIYFITSFNAPILTGTGYQLRVALTNDLTLPSSFTFSNANIEFGNMKYAISNDKNKYSDWYLSNKKYSSIINTDDYQIKEYLNSNMLWEKLYRINKDETSFAYFENTTNEAVPVNNIELFLQNINIPENSVIDKIYLDLYTDSREEITVSPTYQLNTKMINDSNDMAGIFNINSYSIYLNNNARYLYKQLAYYQERENETQIDYYKSLIDTYNRQNANIDYHFSQESPMTICNSYWNEVSFDDTNELQSADVKNVYLIIEGYNHSTKTLLKAQLSYYDGIDDITEVTINKGYFYEKIPIHYNAKYNVEELSIRFKFLNSQKVDLYNIKSELHFRTKQNKILLEHQAKEDIVLNGLNKYSCILCEALDGDIIRNGITIRLNFSEIQNYLKIYSAIVNIVYHEKAFTNIIETSPVGLFSCNVFDEKISDMRQEQYTTKKPNGEYDAGFEMDNRIYQSFTAEEDNITSIELKSNGKIGSPDNLLKIAVLDNYENLPNNVLKEVIVDIRQYNQDEEASKYNICVNNLIIGDTYWFSIEPIDKTKNGARRFFYNNYQVDNFKLLKINNGNVINQHASLYFRLYSKQNNYSFDKLPYKFDIVNDYVKDINFITEIQIYDGYIQNLESSMFDACLCNILHQEYDKNNIYRPSISMGKDSDEQRLLTDNEFDVYKQLLTHDFSTRENIETSINDIFEVDGNKMYFDIENLDYLDLSSHLYYSSIPNESSNIAQNENDDSFDFIPNFARFNNDIASLDSNINKEAKEVIYIPENNWDEDFLSFVADYISSTEQFKIKQYTI